MNSLKILQNRSGKENSPRLSERRRALFPTNCNEADSDLGHMSPLSSDTSSDNEDASIPQSQSSNTGSIGDYDILGIVDNNFTDIINTPQQKIVDFTESMSPLYLSPHITCLPRAKDTPLKFSPSQKLKTPHDTSNTNTKLPKLVRKSLLDSCFSDESTKRKISHENSPVNSKVIKLDPAVHSKVRTALFPANDIAVPSKVFYPKMDDSKSHKITHSNSVHRPTEKIKVTAVRRANKFKRGVGQINAGVKHKIRKPKQKKLSNKVFLKAINIMNDSALQEYLQDLEQINEPVKRLIENKENIFVDKTKKRPRSPEPEQSNKNFKSASNKVEKPDFDTNDLISTDNETRIASDIENIISSLSDGPEESENDKMPGNSIVLQAHGSITESENSILLHNAPKEEISSIANILLSPTSQMCDMASGLALNSPKKVKNLTPLLEGMPEKPNIFSSISSGPRKQFEKLFPIFSLNNRTPQDKKSEPSKVTTRSVKKMRNLPPDQMLLDAGQKKFGVVQCRECKFVYHIGDPSDEIMHSNYHNAGHVFKFNGWKNERIVTSNGDARIIKILQSDSKIWWKKVSELMEVVNRDLGYYDMGISLDNCQVYLYIKNKTIVGCATAVPKDTGYKMLYSGTDEVDLCSEESYPIKCGISRIWVSNGHRSQGIATCLMDSIKKNFMLGSVLGDGDVALSSPTEMGKKFARRYFNTQNFLIYMS